MEGSIISSIFFVISFALLYAGVYRVKKSEKTLNGIVWLMMNLITVLCWGTVTAGIINMVKIPVNIVSIGVVYLISAITLFWKTKRDGEVQKYEWKKFDIIYSAVIGGVIFILLARRITPDLDFVFNNSDAAVHLRNSLTILRTGKLDTMYFAPLHNSLITEVFLPFIEKIHTYKVFLVVDAMTFILESIFFMAVIREYFTKKMHKVLGVLLAFVYIFGYPFHSYLLSFFYWGIGVMLIEYVIILMREYWSEGLKHSVLVFQLMIGCASITMCYMLFGPISYIAVFACLCVHYGRKHTLFSWNTVKTCLQIFLLPCILSVYYCYFVFLKKQNLSIEGVLTMRGGIYGELFINFIWVMPFVFFMLWRAVKKKKIDENMIFLISFLVMIAAIGALAMIGKASAYYYFKFYYPMWMLCFVITAQALVIIYDEYRDILIAGVLTGAVLAGISATNFEEKVQYRGLGYGDRTSILFDIYYNNVSTYRNRIVPCNEDYLDACKFVMENIGKDESVPMVSIINDYTLCYWYEALTGQDSSDFYGWDYTIPELVEKLNNQEVKYFVMNKKYPFYQSWKEYFDGFKCVYENKEIFIGETVRE